MQDKHLFTILLQQQIILIISKFSKLLVCIDILQDLLVQMIVAPNHFQDQECGSVDFGVKPQTYISMSYFHEKLSEIKGESQKIQHDLQHEYSWWTFKCKGTLEGVDFQSNISSREKIFLSPKKPKRIQMIFNVENWSSNTSRQKHMQTFSDCL